MSRKPSDQEVEARIEKVRTRVRDGKADPRFVGPVDPYEIRERNQEALKGAVQRNPEVWNKVMESHGFVWYLPSQLDAVVGTQRIIPRHLDGLFDGRGLPVENAHLYTTKSHEHGQWRRSLPTKMAFTVEDLFSLFRTPEQFQTWVREQDRKFELRKKGILLR
jgi:hypothetical protein